MLILDYKKLNITIWGKFDTGRSGLYLSLVMAIVGLGGAYAAGSCRDPESTAYVVSLGAAVLVYLTLTKAFSNSRYVFPWLGTSLAHLVNFLFEKNT